MGSDNLPDKKVMAEDQDPDTTIVEEFPEIGLPDVGGLSGRFGGGFGGGGVSQVDLSGSGSTDGPGGGVVGGTTDTTVTIQFPDGIPTGRVELPGTETTVVEEHLEGGEDESFAGFPLGSEETIAAVGSLESSFHLETATDEQHRSFRVPCPGTTQNYIWFANRFLVNPTNKGQCPIFLISISHAGGIIIRADGSRGTMLKPGHSVPVYHAEPDAAFIAVSCSSQCGHAVNSSILQVDA